MDPKLQRRIIAFYIGGIVNALLGLYVLIEGLSFLTVGTQRTLAVVFLAFAAVDFYFPYSMKKKWLADHAEKRQEQGADPARRL